MNQARIHDLLLAGMKNAPAGLVPVYNRRLVAVQVDDDHGQGLDRYVVAASFERVDSDPGETGGVADAKPAIDTVRAGFIVGCDGARSTVRRSLDIALHGDSTSKAWGVMDERAPTRRSRGDADRDDSPFVRFRQGSRYLMA